MILCLMTWDRVAPLLPPRPPRRRRYPGRLPVDDRAALRGIVYVLRKGVSWADVPAKRIGERALPGPTS
ncbi:transposase [Streptomyces werraensis]|uniref:transposase n=1 Tax=Streptomyces werraensis TaxID=68284 RepID=UPI0037FF0C8B